MFFSQSTLSRPRVPRVDFLPKTEPKWIPNVSQNLQKKGIKKNLENTPRKDNKNDSQLAPCGAPVGLVWRLWESNRGDRIKVLRSWRPLRSSFGFSVPPGSSGTLPGTPPRAPFWVIFGNLNRFWKPKRSKKGARI